MRHDLHLNPANHVNPVEAKLWLCEVLNVDSD